MFMICCPVLKNNIWERSHMTIYSISCDPECSFVVQSHDEEEVIGFAKAHLRTAHDKTMSDSEIGEMIVTVEK